MNELLHVHIPRTAEPHDNAEVHRNLVSLRPFGGCGHGPAAVAYRDVCWYSRCIDVDQTFAETRCRCSDLATETTVPRRIRVSMLTLVTGVSPSVSLLAFYSAGR